MSERQRQTERERERESAPAAEAVALILAFLVLVERQLSLVALCRDGACGFRIGLGVKVRVLVRAG